MQELAASFDYGAEDQRPSASADPVWLGWDRMFDVRICLGINLHHGEVWQGVRPENCTFVAKLKGPGIANRNHEETRPTLHAASLPS